MGRYTSYLVAGSLILVLGCGDSNRDTSTSPEFAPGTSGCDLSTARSLVNSIFPASQRTTVNGKLQIIQDAGAGTETATNAGFDLLALLATHGPGSPTNSSAFANAIIPCQNVGPVSLPIDFTAAFGTNGAFEVRGGSGTDKTAAVSHDGLWGLEPPFNTAATPVQYTWDQITVAPTRFPPASNPSNKRFLAYGLPITDPDFTTEEQVGTIFEWFTIPTSGLPTLSFDPGVVVGTCFTDGSGSEYLIQHNAADNNGELIPSATPTFCPASLSSRESGWSLASAAHRLIDLFRPQPLLAAALGTRPPGGSLKNLSPSAAVDPNLITIAFVDPAIADGRTNQLIRTKAGDVVKVTVTPAGNTKMDGVFVKLIAINNLGTTVTSTGDVEPTADGVATFSRYTISKAGGYKLLAILVGFGQNNTSGFEFNSVESNRFTLQQRR